jgi:hypothetical protein
MTDAMTQDMIATDAMIQGMIQTIMEWAKNAMTEGQKVTPRDYKEHFPDIMRWGKEDRKKLKEGIENWLTDIQITDMVKTIIEWTNTKYINVENVTPRDYKEQFPDIMRWGKEDREKLSDRLEQWLKDEPKNARKNRRDRNSRHAKKIAEGKKVTVELTPEEAAAKKAAALEHKRKRDKERRKNIKKISERVKTLDSVLNPYMHHLLQTLAEPEDDIIPDCILLRDLLALANDQKYPSIDVNDYQEWISERFKCFNQHFPLTIRFMMENFPTSDKDVENVQNLMQQVSASTSTPGNVFANPTARDDNVSDSSCDSDDSGSDEDAPVAKKARVYHLSDVGSDSGSDSEDKPTPRTPVTPGGPYSRSVSPARSPVVWYDRADSPGY